MGCFDRLSWSRKYTSMRITGGKARGIPLVVPKGNAVRPATDAMRQAVFSSIAPWLLDAVFLDLFAGSGAYGLEAISRGAKSGIFVELDVKAVACIRQNINAVSKSLGHPESTLNIINMDAATVAITSVPDLIFIDPPYGLIPRVAPELFTRLTAILREKADPLIIFEMPGELTLSPAGWDCVKRLGKGIRQPTVCIFRRTRALTEPR